MINEKGFEGDSEPFRITLRELLGSHYNEERVRQVIDEEPDQLQIIIRQLRQDLDHAKDEHEREEVRRYWAQEKL